MAIRKRSINSQGTYTDYKHLANNYNETNLANFSHEANLPTNFNLKTITLEDIDMAVFQEFNNRFKIGEKIMPLIILDAEVSSLHNANYLQFDENKQFLNGPYFTIFRTEARPLRRTSPTSKKVVYSKPVSSANGIVFEEYITEGPKEYNLLYELKFITNYREYTNQMEAEMRHFFRNKRNMVICNNERFVIGPDDQNQLSKLEMVNREDVALRTLYVTTFTLKLWCFTRDLSNMQKRLRPNTFTLDITTQDSLNKEEDSSNINIERFDVDTEGYTTHP